MDSTVIVAIISFFGTLVGAAGGTIASARLIQYRLEQLEKKVESQGKASADIPVMQERITNINRRVHNLEKRYSSGVVYFEAGQ